MNEWAWILLGCALGVTFSTIGFFCIIKQNDDLQRQVIELTEKVENYERIMNYFGWLKNQ